MSVWQYSFIWSLFVWFSFYDNDSYLKAKECILQDKREKNWSNDFYLKILGFVNLRIHGLMIFAYPFLCNTTLATEVIFVCLWLMGHISESLGWLLRNSFSWNSGDQEVLLCIWLLHVPGPLSLFFLKQIFQKSGHVELTALQNMAIMISGLHIWWVRFPGVEGRISSWVRHGNSPFSHRLIF